MLASKADANAPADASDKEHGDTFRSRSLHTGYHTLAVHLISLQAPIRVSEIKVNPVSLHDMFSHEIRTLISKRHSQPVAGP